MDPILVFWKAFGIFNEGNVNEAIRELTRVEGRREVQYAAAHALIHYHDRCRNKDQATIDTYVVELESREELAGDRDLLCAATFLCHIQQLKKAGQQIQKLLEINPGNLNAQAIRGWIYHKTGKDELQQKAMTMFESVLQEGDGNPRHLEAMLGRAKLHEKFKQYDNCLMGLSEITVMYPNFIPALIEKAKIHIQNGEWDNSIDYVTQVSMTDTHNVEAKRIFCYYLLARENDMESFIEKFNELLEAMRVSEPRNGDLYYNYARLFARFSGRNPQVLGMTSKLLDSALALQPDNPAYLCEYGL